MKLTVGFTNGNKTDFVIDSFRFDEYENVLKLKKDEKLVGLISANQIAYWFCEENEDEL